MPKKVIPPRVVVAIHEKGWMDENGMRVWIEKVWSKRPGGLLKKPALLVLDQFRAHISETTKKRFKQVKTQLAVIPGCLSSQLQPLDVSINKPFKVFMREERNKWMATGNHDLTPTERMKRPTITQVCEWMKTSWQSVKNQTIVRSFKKCGISNALDGTEDEIIYEYSEGQSSSHTALKIRSVRWCVTSDSELKKCKDLTRSCRTQDLTLLCVKKSTPEECFTAIQNGEADAISVDSGNVFQACLHPYNLKPIMAESYGSQKDTCYYAVAVVRKSSIFKFNELKNKRSCHTGVGHMAGWYTPLRILHEKKLLNWTGNEAERAVSKFFSSSCVPGSQEQNLCKHCAGWGSRKCKLNKDEPYYDEEGAFKCLKDFRGEVAFVTHMSVPVNLQKNFQLLCPDNTRKPSNQYQLCSLSRFPVNAVLTRSAGDKTKDIVDFLQYSQKNKCDLFSSKYGKHLLFKDYTSSIIPLPPAVDAFLYLGADLYNSIKALHGENDPEREVVRWCTQSRQEKIKCDNWMPVSKGAIECTEASSAEECIQQIMKGEADAVTLDGGYMYTAGKCGLVPVLGEYYNQEDLKPCKTSGSKTQGTYYAVAVVKKSNKAITWNNLKGKKSCHTAVGRTAGWNIPVGLINSKNNNCEAGSYFSQSCAPGSDINSKLCQLCIGDPQKLLSNTKCSPSDAEAYYGYSGALRCLVEIGDVAFVKHTTVFENTEGRNPANWARRLKPSDFELLCPDGSRASVDNYKTCNLATVPAHAVVTRSDKRSGVLRIVTKQQALFGRSGIQRQKFQLFDSKDGKDLLFKDSTQCLIEIDQKTTMEDFLGKAYFSAVSAINKCSPISELLSACSFQKC
ncbi:serotransferrin-B-like [Gastrophryne carolinensis]